MTGTIPGGSWPRSLHHSHEPANISALYSCLCTARSPTMSIMREGNFSFGRAQFGGLVMKASTPAAGTELSPRAHRDAIAYSRGGASCSPRRDQTRWQARHHAPPSSLTKNLIWRQRKSLPSLKGWILSFLHGPYFFKPRNVKRFQSCHQPRMQDHRRRPSMHVVCIRPLHSYSLHYHNFKVECYSNVVQK